MPARRNDATDNGLSRATFLLLLAPALVLLLLSLYPFLSGLYTSLTDQKLYAAGGTRFVGLGNFVRLAGTPLFWTALGNTLTYTALVVAIQLPLGLAFALLLDIPGRLQSFFRSVLVLPLLIPPVVAGLMWKTMMQPQQGVLNYLLSFLGIDPQPWLANPSTAMISVVLIDTWLFTPLAAIIMLAGLQSISVELTEAARVDGASPWQIVRRIKLPLLGPYVLLVALFRVSDALKSLEIIYATTRGGPLNATRTLHVMAYEEAYRWSNLGRAMAIVFVLWALCYAISGTLLGLWQRQEARRHAR